MTHKARETREALEKIIYAISDMFEAAQNLMNVYKSTEELTEPEENVKNYINEQVMKSYSIYKEL